MTGPLSLAQQRVWFFSRLEPGSPLYTGIWASRWLGPLDQKALEAGIAEIIRRHAVLRTRFPASDEGPIAEVDHVGSFHLPLHPCTVPPQEREEEAREWALAEACRPFDLAREHPLRATLLRLGPQDHVLALTIHQIAFDRWSRDVIRQELVALYQAFAAGRPSPLTDPPAQYQDYARAQIERVASGGLGRELAYWRDRLDGAPQLLALPTDLPRPTSAGHQGAQLSLRLPSALVSALVALGQQHRATLFMTLLAAFKALICRWTGQSDLVIGVPIAGRLRPEYETLVGCFTNTLVLRTNLGGDPTFRELIGRVRTVALGAYAHQEIPFELLVRELRPERTMGQHPLFQVLFNFLAFPRPVAEVPGLRIEEMELQPPVALVDLSLGVRGMDGEFSCQLSYNPQLFLEQAMSELLQRFHLLLEAVAERPDQRLSALALASDEPRLAAADRVIRTVEELTEEEAVQLLAAELRERSR